MDIYPDPLCARTMMFPHLNPRATCCDVHYDGTDVEVEAQRR